MKRYKIAIFGLLALAAMATTSCSDPDDEIKSLEFGRNFSPLGIEAKNVKETTADINWNSSYGATSYNLEVYADDSLTFAGTPEKVITDITSMPYTVEGLQFDTQYSVRVQAVTEGDDSRTSTWNGVYFRTSAKQFLKNPKEDDILDRSVVLTWEVEDGYDVTTIKIGDITHEITAEERAAGKATISGLNPETEYTAYLYYNGKQCGNRKFTTIADLEGATIVTPEDNLRSLLENAEEGQVFALQGGTYRLSNEDGEVISAKISKSITIKGIRSTNRPVIYGRIQLDEPLSLLVSQTVWNMTENNSTDQFINFKGEGVYPSVVIENTEVIGAEGQKGFFYLNVTATVNEFTVNNCVVHDIECSGGDLFDSRKGYIAKLSLTNSTFYECAKARDFIRYDDASGSFSGVADPEVVVDHCTLYNVGATEANYRLIYVRFANNHVTFTNNIVEGTNYKRGFTNQKSTDPEPTLQNNYYFNTVNLVSAGASADASITWFDENGTVLSDSPFKNASGGDFTLDVDSKAYAGAAGDPRWR